MPPLCGTGKHVLRTGFLYAVQTYCICNGIRFIQADDRNIGLTADLDLPFSISEAKPSGRGERRPFRPAGSLKIDGSRKNVLVLAFGLKKFSAAPHHARLAQQSSRF